MLHPRQTSLIGVVQAFQPAPGVWFAFTQAVLASIAVHMSVSLLTQLPQAKKKFHTSCFSQCVYLK